MTRCPSRSGCLGSLWLRQRHCQVIPASLLPVCLLHWAERELQGGTLVVVKFVYRSGRMTRCPSKVPVVQVILARALRHDARRHGARAAPQQNQGLKPWI